MNTLIAVLFTTFLIRVIVLFKRLVFDDREYPRFVNKDDDAVRLVIDMLLLFWMAIYIAVETAK
jgi:hypothetical protein